jgi:hypothetical protein
VGRLLLAETYPTTPTSMMEKSVMSTLENPEKPDLLAYFDAGELINAESEMKVVLF